MMNNISRKYTRKILDLIDEGILHPDNLIVDILNWLSESQVKQFFEDSEFDDINELSEYDPILDKDD